MLDGVVPPILVGLVAAVVLVTRAWTARRAAAGWLDAAVVLTLLLTVGTLERMMGRPFTYRNGPVRLWSGDISSDQNSQQVADPYTFTHVTHGVLFYGVTRVALPFASRPVRMLVSLALEGAWEAYENTDTVIERYRAVTIALGYYGDSVLNSVADMLACLVGFWLTARLPRRATVAWVIAVELALAFWIRDNLTLNLLMLISPIEAVRQWQAGA